jgi:carbon dioxide concentrating mechanism protein CcmN
MYLPPLQAMHDSQTRRIGNVTIHPSVAIAPGVLLQAEEDSQIMIAASVCIGMGSVIHAYGGVLEIQEGVNLGAGVLIIGSGVIGSYACIGTSSTIIESSISSQQILPPGSLLGDHSRSAQPGAVSIPAVAQSPSSPDPWHSESSYHSAVSAMQSGTPQSSSSGNGKKTVHGKDYVNNLLSTLLPNHAQSIPPSKP